MPISGDILKANDSVTNVMTLYKERIGGEKRASDYSSAAKGGHK